MLRGTVRRIGQRNGWWGTPRGMRSGLRLLARIGLEPATIADVGASDGTWSRSAQATFPSARLVLFEPQPVHAAALHGFGADHPDATIVHRAVGGTRGVSHFDAADPWGGVLQDEPTESSISVDVTTLDAELADVAPPFLVKLDTHGVEREILGGAQETLGRSVAWIVEAYNQRIAADAMLFWELCTYMSEHGFRPIDLADVLHRPHDATLWQMDLFFVQSEWEGFSHLEYR